MRWLVGTSPVSHGLDSPRGLPGLISCLLGPCRTSGVYLGRLSNRAGPYRPSVRVKSSANCRLIRAFRTLAFSTNLPGSWTCLLHPLVQACAGSKSSANCRLILAVRAHGGYQTLFIHTIPYNFLGFGALVWVLATPGCTPGGLACAGSNSMPQSMPFALASRCSSISRSLTVSRNTVPAPIVFISGHVLLGRVSACLVGTFCE